jgi:hypothetical protein
MEEGYPAISWATIMGTKKASFAASRHSPMGYSAGFPIQKDKASLINKEIFVKNVR